MSFNRQSITPQRERKIGFRDAIVFDGYKTLVSRMKRRTCIRLKWYYRRSICLSHEFIDESHCQFEIPYLHPWLPKEIDRQENQVEEQRTVSAQTLSLCFSSLFIFIPALQVSFSKTVLIWVYPWSTATAISQLPGESSLLFIFTKGVGCIIIFTRGFHFLRWPYIGPASFVPWILPDLSEAFQ